MDLTYLTQLNERGITALINYCLTEKFGLKAVSHNMVGWAYVHSEEDRRDLNNNRYYYVETIAGPRVLNDYRITDFSLRVNKTYMTHDGIEYVASKDNFDKEMRMFMAMRFGQSYVDDLFRHQMQEIEAEKASLESMIGIGRK